LREVGTPPQSPAAGGDAGEHFPFQPPLSVARFLLVMVPPDSRADRSGAAVDAVTAEIRQKIPDLLGVLGVLGPARERGCTHPRPSTSASSSPGG
jgi:hypothetical protein